MKNGFDISTIEGDGYLIFPLSMSRLDGGQTPKEIYETIEHFSPKLKTFSNDAVILYSNGLYFNAENLTYEQRVKSNKKMLDHSNALRKLIAKKRKYIPGAFHFLPMDYVILNSKHFAAFFKKLKDLEKVDSNFRKVIKKDMRDREYNEANVNFILEETAISHIIRQRMVEFPRTLVKNDFWRLYVYPGSYIHADLYQWKKKILPQTDTINPFGGAAYDSSKNRIYVFDEI